MNITPVKTLFYLNGFFLAVLIGLLIAQRIQLGELTKDYATTQTKAFTEDLNISLKQLVEVAAQGGEVIHEYIQRINRHEDLTIRVINAPEVIRQYGSDDNELPRTDQEKAALQDGLDRFWEEENDFVRLTAITAETGCGECHMDSSDRPVQTGEILGLLEVRVSAEPLKKAERQLALEMNTELGILVLVFFLYGYSVYKLTSSVDATNRKLSQTMTDLKKSQDVIIRTQKMAGIGNLADGVAHEILNPLNIMSTTIQLMKTEERSKEDEENLNDMLHQIQRATKIINQMRELTATNIAETETMSLNDTLEKVFALAGNSLEKSGITVERHYDETLPEIPGDAGRISQLFINLLDNARDAVLAKGGGSITITTGKKDDYALLTVADTGAGIPEAEKSRVFDPFFTTKDPDQGTGMGLSIAHAIVESHHGRVELESRKGKGTTVTVFLPLG